MLVATAGDAHGFGVVLSLSLFFCFLIDSHKQSLKNLDFCRAYVESMQ